MKLTKYLLVAAVALFAASCSDKEDWNTDSDVTVEMANATMNPKENASFVNVPIKVTGKTNGPIKVNVKVGEYSDNPAVEDVNYIVTSKSVVIPADSIQVGIEIALVNDMEINENRMFTVTIESAEGAQIGQQNTTVITIRDDDALFYDAIQGSWKFSYYSYFDGAYASDVLTITGVEEDEEGYESVLYFSGWAGTALICEAEYSYDKENNEITLTFPLGQSMGTLNFSGIGAADVFFFSVNGEYVADEGEIYATVDSSLRKISFNPDDAIFLGVIQGSDFLGGFDYYLEMEMTR